RGRGAERCASRAALAHPRCAYCQRGRVTRDEPVPLREALAALQRELGAPSVDVFAVIESAWTKVAGDDVARHSRVRSMHDGECTIEVENAVWATRARYLAGDLSRVVNERLGRPVVAGVNVVVSGPRRAV